MLYRNHQQRPRQGIILLVVLALLTLFASIGVAFVYFSEAEVNKSAGQKTGETVKLPDADLLFNIVLKQLIFPTNNNNSALYTQSLLENMYGRPSAGNPGNISAYNGTGWIANFDLATGQDNLYRRNMQFQTYNEAFHGSLNPTYTYPDHKNPYLGAVAANWRQPDFTNHIIGIPHGPVAIARSFAREMKFRIAFTTSTGGGFHEIILNPYSNAVFPSGVPHAAFWTNTVGMPLIVGDLPNFPAPDTRTYVPNTTVTCAPDGTGAQLIITPQTALQHSLRPSRYTNPLFPPPGDLGGDVKNLPPEVKTLVGFNGTTPVFANNDSYWMDFGFPAIPWSNNRKVKPMAAVFIKDNDGNVNLNVAGNLRGRDVPAVPDPNATGHVSAHGLGPWEINLLKLGIPIAEVRQLIAGAQVGSTYERGRAGFATDADPTTSTTGYWPLVRGAPYYSLYNLDGSNDGLAATNSWLGSNPWQLAGDPVLPGTERLFLRWPYFFNPLPAPYLPGPTPANGFLSGALGEITRNGFVRSPLFISPFAPPQVVARPPLTGNEFSTGGISHQRRFGFHNQESLYRLNDTGTDKLDGEIRKLMPTAFSSPQQRWQMTTISNDLNVVGYAPWHNGQDPNPENRYMVNRALTLPPPLNVLYPLDTNSSRGAGLPRQFPGAAQSTGEFANIANYLWRSAFGNQNRIDLSRQLTDYPLPIDNNTLLDLTNPVVRSRYMIALHARQKLADELYRGLVNLTHPDTTPQPPDDPAGIRTLRWLAQLAVNIVDYIDNDDYPTWFQVYDPRVQPAPLPGTATIENVVMGTELPRLVINEVYAEAVNDPADPLPSNRAQNDYNVRHWVELYNPLMNAGYAGVWPDAANARLNVAGTSVYRLIVTTNINPAFLPTDPDYNNISRIRNSENNLGNPDSPTAAHTNIIQFPADATVEPSDVNYGTGAQSSVPAPNPGFYLIGPPSQPFGTTPPANPNEEAAFPPNNLDSPQMEIIGRVQRSNTRFNDDNRQAILLQRLANPYLPHNPNPIDPLLPYNPYITIDYVRNVRIAHAVQYNQDGNPDNDPIEQRRSMGKLQPYASVNEPAVPAPPQPSESVWMDQIPDVDKSRAGHNPYTSQIQHTFLRHNGVETPFPLTTAPVNEPTNQPNQVANGLLAYNTLKLPFEWLKHLDRAPTSPADLLHVSGYRPHELTQQFNRISTVNATTFPATLTAAAVVNFTGPFVNQLHGTPYSIKNTDLVEIVYTISDGMTTRLAGEWVLTQNVILTGPVPSFDAVTTLTTMPGETVTGAQVRQIVPFAHYAPWYRAHQNVDIQSSNRIYRLLEGVAVRNPGVHVGQYRFTSGALPTNSNNIYRVAAADTPPIGSVVAPSDENSVWIQLDNGVTVIPGDGVPNHASTHMISTNDALISMVGAANPQLDPTRAPVNNFTAANVGDTVVINAGQPTEERAMILEIDHQNNRIRTVLSTMPAPGTNASIPLTIDFAYVAGRQPGRINLNTVWDIETFQALADAQLMNAFTNTGGGPFDNNVDAVYHRLIQQRQPQYFYGPRLVGHTGSNGLTPEDRPLQGMGTGDIAASPVIPQQGIGNTFLSDRYQEAAGGFVPLAGGARALDMNSPIGPDVGDPHRFTRTLFEVGAPGLAHPARRFELLSKIWNNSTVRSNTFSVWITIGFFEFDEATNSIGAELGQLQGKNVRHRFFAIVDRSSIDSWLRSWALHAPNTQPASINLFMNSSLFPTLDPRHETYPLLSPNIPTSTALSTLYSRIAVPATFINLPGNASFLPGVWGVTFTGPNPFAPLADNIGRLVQVQSDVGTEIAQIVAQPAGAPAADVYLKLTINHAGPLTIRGLPVPPTVLHWSQLK